MNWGIRFVNHLFHTDPDTQLDEFDNTGLYINLVPKLDPAEINVKTGLDARDSQQSCLLKTGLRNLHSEDSVRNMDQTREKSVAARHLGKTWNLIRVVIIRNKLPDRRSLNRKSR